MKVTQKRKQILFALFAIAVLMGACSVFGQIQTSYRYKERPDIKTLSPTFPLQFGVVGNGIDDKTNGLMSMYVDEIGKDSADIMFYVYYPTHRDASKYEVIVKFNDGKFVKLWRNVLNKEFNYAEYVVNKDAYKEFFTAGVEGVLFRSENKNETFHTPMYAQTKFFYYFLHVCKNWP